jgi:CIC family chloride channel protein
MLDSFSLLAKKVLDIAPAWIISKLTNRQFLIMGAVVVGLWTGLTAVILKVSVHYLLETLKALGQGRSWIHFVSPFIGILCTYVFVKLFLGGELIRGTSHVLMAIAKKSSFLPRKEVFSHAATSALTVGFGGSAGLESPIVQTGSAIGSIFSSFFSLGYRDRTLLLACGAASGIATAFNAPIAGVLFALEVLLVDINVSAFIPLLIAGATGALCSKVILSEGILLSFRQITEFNYHNIPYYIVLGIVCGVVAVFYIRSFLGVEEFFKKHFQSAGLRLLVGGVSLGFMIVLFPALFGEGYTSIKELAASRPQDLFQGSPLYSYTTQTNWALGFAILLTGIVKVFAVSFTLNAGGNGGNFAPSLVVGACVGFSLAFLSNATGLTTLSTSNFCVVAMAGILTGIFHSPLTAIFLIAEITGGYDLIIPLMIVSALSTAVSKYFSPHSLDEAKLSQTTDPKSFGKDAQVLSDLSLAAFIETNFVILHTGSSLRTLAEAVAKSKRNIFPVVDPAGKLIGIIALEDVREIMFNTHQYDSTLVDSLMRKPLATASINDDMQRVMEKFDKTGVWNIPVLRGDEYVGFVSKSQIFSNYRDRLKHE